MRPSPRGFTLVELAFVLLVIGLLAGVAAPTYVWLSRAAKESEARALLQAIAHAQLTHQRDTGAFIACAPSGEGPVPRGKSERFASEKPGWMELGFSVDGSVRYRYEVVLDGESFKAIARGDLDGDGKASELVLHGGDLRFEARDRLE